MVQPRKVKGSTVESFIAEAQDRTRNALATSLSAAFNAWQEQLKADQVSFESDKILRLDCVGVLNPFKLHALGSALSAEDCQIKVWARICKKAISSHPTAGGPTTSSKHHEPKHFSLFSARNLIMKSQKLHTVPEVHSFHGPYTGELYNILIQNASRSATAKLGRSLPSTFTKTSGFFAERRPRLIPRWCPQFTPGLQRVWVRCRQWNQPKITP